MASRKTKWGCFLFVRDWTSNVIWMS